MEEEYDISERSFINSSHETIPATKDDFLFYKAPFNDTIAEDALVYTEDQRNREPLRKRDRVAFRLDQVADWVWDTTANTLQIKTIGSGWTAETCSYLFAVLSFLGLVATLFAHQNKPLPEWPQLITINSIVSLFSLLMRAGAGLVLAEGISQSKWQWFRRARKLNDMERFDAASRSAWGSVELLFHTRPEALSLVVAFGALVTILATLTGFFLQQLMVFQDCLQRDPTASVLVARTNNCKIDYWGSVQLNYDPEPPMIAAINSAMAQSIPDHTNVVMQGCLSGNCTFLSDHGSSFSTLAVGSSCHDIGEKLRKPDNTSKTLSLSIGGNNIIEVCPDCHDPPVVMATKIGVTSYQDSRTLATIYIVSTNASCELDGCMDWQAVQCSLFPTVNTYALEIKNSKMNETLLESTPIPSNPLGDTQQNTSYAEYERLSYSHRLIANRTLRNGVWKECEQMSEFDLDIKPIYTGLNTLEYYHKDCIWGFSRALAGQVSLYLAELFDNQTLRYGKSEVDPEYWKNHSLGQNPPPQKIGPPHLRQMYTFGNFTEDTAESIMEGVSQAMTTVVRTYYSDGNETHTKGTMWITTTCIRIDWRWISFPAIMIALTGIFLALVIIENRGLEQDRLWKSSVLATLFCEVDRSDEGNNYLVNKQAMYNAAKSTSVSLESRSGTLRLLAR